MADDDNLIPCDEPAFRLELTAAQLKVTHTALHLLLDGYGHDEYDVIRVVRQVLDKLPSDADMRIVQFTAPTSTSTGRDRPAAG